MAAVSGRLPATAPRARIISFRAPAVAERVVPNALISAADASRLGERIAFTPGNGTLSQSKHGIACVIVTDPGEGMRATSSGWAVWGACALLAAGALASDLSLVNDAGSAAIVLPDLPAPATREAAAMLQKYVERSTASPLRVLPERAASAGGPRIWLGRSRAVDLLVGERLDRLSADGFLIKTEGDRLVVAGRTPLGDRHAAQEFLRRYCGVECYMPGGLWEVVRRQQTLAIPEVDMVVEPAFASRARNGMNSGASAGLNAAWAVAQGSVSRHEFDAESSRLLRPERYATRPELFAQVGGRRAVPGAGSARGWQVCMTSPAVIEECARLAEERLARREESLSVSATPNPGGGFCECGACRALWDETAPPQARRTRLVVHFANQVAARLARFRPDRLVALKAEETWAEPVAGVAVGPNVILFVDGCGGALDAAKREALCARLRAWKAAGARRLGLHERRRGSALATPDMRTAALAQEARLAREEGVEAWASEDYPSWGLQGPQHWVVARMLWDPRLDAAALTEQFCSELFGPASASMRDCFRRCEESAARGESFPAEARRAMRQSLAQAEREAFGVEPEYSRVRYFSVAFAWSERMAAWSEGGAAALRAARAGDCGGALAALGSLGGEEDDPLVFMRVALDPLAGAHYCRSSGLGAELLDRLGSAVRARALLAERALNVAALRPGAAAGAEAMERALDAVIAEQYPGALNAPARQALAGVRKLTAKYAFVPESREAPAVDGDSGDAAWRAAPEETGFNAAGGLLAAQCRTTFRLVRRGEWLYAAFDCFQPMDGPKGTSTARDGQARFDDAVEIVLAPAIATPHEKPLRVVVTVKGVVQVENGGEESAQIRAAARERADRWCAEIAVPFRAAGIGPASSRGARLNVARYVRGRGATPEESAWFPVFADEGGILPKGWLLFAVTARDR
jgi:hypothetical protein